MRVCFMVGRRVAIFPAILACQLGVAGALAQSWEGRPGSAEGSCELSAADAGYRLVLSFEIDGRVVLTYTDEQLAGRRRGETEAKLSLIDRNGKASDFRTRGVLKQTDNGPLLVATIMPQIPSPDFGVSMIDALGKARTIIVAVPAVKSERSIDMAAASASLAGTAACHR